MWGLWEDLGCNEGVTVWEQGHAKDFMSWKENLGRFSFSFELAIDFCEDSVADVVEEVGDYSEWDAF